MTLLILQQLWHHLAISTFKFSSQFELFICQVDKEDEDNALLQAEIANVDHGNLGDRSQMHVTSQANYVQEVQKAIQGLQDVAIDDEFLLIITWCEHLGENDRRPWKDQFTAKSDEKIKPSKAKGDQNFWFTRELPGQRTSVSVLSVEPL